MSENWTIKRMLDWMSGYLAQHDDPDPVISTRWLLSDATGLSFMELYTNFDRPLSPSELDKLREDVKRRASGTPLQYITGKTTFRFLDLKTAEGVLIPRPETEVLVSEALALLPREKFSVEADAPEQDLLVCDLCTGSGCIACSIAYENPRTRVFATDISDACVALANENVRALGLAGRVEVLKSDLGEGVFGLDLGEGVFKSELGEDVFKSDFGEGVLPERVGRFDAVVSNPPYIPTSVMAALPEEVALHEPELALHGGKDGLDVFRRIVEWSLRALKPGGFMAVELHEESLEKAREEALEAGFSSASVKMDLNNLPRVLVAIK